MVPASCSGAHALLLGRDDVEREDRQHRAVHRHRDAHLVQRDAVEQLAHVVDGVDRDARHADVAADPHVVAVVAAVGRQIERDRKALLATGEIAAVEGVGLLGGREAGVLADGPRLGRVHRRVRPAQVRRKARPGVQEVQIRECRRRCRARRRRCLRGCARPARTGPCRRSRARLAPSVLAAAGRRGAPVQRQPAEVRNPSGVCSFGYPQLGQRLLLDGDGVAAAVQERVDLGVRAPPSPGPPASREWRPLAAAPRRRQPPNRA